MILCFGIITTSFTKGVIPMNENWHLPPSLAPPPPQKFSLNVAVIDPYEREVVPDFCHIVPIPPGLWVNDVLSTVFEKWCISQPILIVAPTGGGKTTFVQTIVKHRQRKKVLYVSHRLMINAQQKMAICKALKSKWSSITEPHAFDLIDTFDDIGLTIISYQKLAIQHQNMDLSEYGWVIFDECHCFYSDALLNLHLDNLLTKIPTLFRNAHRIYMTATPGAVLPDICRVEQAAMRWCDHYMPCFRESCGQLLMYQFATNFDGIRLHFFKQQDEIINLVRSHPDEKFLIFTSRKESDNSSPARSYVQLLKKAGVGVTYLDRNEKGSDTWNQLCRNERFDSQVLVCTSVLDCGVNVHDDNLTHIVVETTDKTEFLQMLGRKRRKVGEVVHVYVRALSKTTLLFRQQQYNRGIRIAESSLHAFADSQFFRIFQAGWYDESPGNLYAHVLAPKQNGHTEVKQTAYHALRTQGASISRLLEDGKIYGDEAWPRMVCKWIDREFDPSAITWLGDNQKKQAILELSELMKKLEGTEFSEVAWAEPFAKIKELLSLAIQESHDNNRNLKHKAVNNRLAKLKIPFVIEALDSNRYTIMKVTTETNTTAEEDI